MDYLNRQSGLITDQQRTMNIGIIGVGGIGSHTAIALARMGFHNLTIYDDDAVSLQNCSSQGFDMSDVGKPKVMAIRQTIMRAVRAVVKVRQSRVHKDSDLRHDVIIMAVDSMAARRDIFAACCAGDTELVINPSMGGEYMSIDTYDLSGNVSERDKVVKEFDKAWFSDDEASPETCTTKATIFTTLTIAGYICKIIKDVAVGNAHVSNIAYDIANNTPVHMYNNNGESLI